MRDRTPLQPLRARRRATQARIAAQRRALIGAAWTDFEGAATRGETRLRRVLTWTRRGSVVATLVAAWWTLRPRAAGAGTLEKALGLIAASAGLRRLAGRRATRSDTGDGPDGL